MTEEFELRHAEPGQEFGYTTTERRRLDEGEDPPAGTTLAVETDDDGNSTRFAIVDGVQRTLKADDQGVVTPKTAEDVAILDQFDVPRARKAMAERKADKPATEPAKEG